MVARDESNKKLKLDNSMISENNYDSFKEEYASKPVNLMNRSFQILRTPIKIVRNLSRISIDSMKSENKIQNSGFQKIILPNFGKDEMNQEFGKNTVELNPSISKIKSSKGFNDGIDSRRIDKKSEEIKKDLNKTMFELNKTNNNVSNLLFKNVNKLSHQEIEEKRRANFASVGRSKTIEYPFDSSSC